MKFIKSFSMAFPDALGVSYSFPASSSALPSHSSPKYNSAPHHSPVPLHITCILLSLFPLDNLLLTTSTPFLVAQILHIFQVKNTNLKLQCYDPLMRKFHSYIFSLELNKSQLYLSTLSLPIHQLIYIYLFPQELCSVSKIVVVDSPMGSWLDLEYLACVSYSGVGLKSYQKEVGYHHNIMSVLAPMDIICHTGCYCFRVLAIVNRTSVNMNEHWSLSQEFKSLVYSPRSGTAEPRGQSTPCFLRNAALICTVATPVCSQQCLRDPLSKCLH